MVASIQSSVTPQSTGGAGTNDDSAVAVQAQLSRCQRQLGDWEACASSKTPEGRKIIENLRSRIGTLESKVANASKPATAAPNAGARNTVTAIAPQMVTQTAAAMGSLLNVFA